MDGSMRDLNLIREDRRDDREGGVRRMALLGLSGLGGVGLVLGLTLAAGSGAAETPSEPDPLARLAPSSGLRAVPDATDVDPEVDRVALTFPERLTDDPPELAAAIAAANAELAHPEPVGARAPVVSVAEMAARVPSALPAAIAATADGDSLARVAVSDALVSSSLPAATGPSAAAGHDGEYTIQVISYDSPEGAQAFAAGLRARGHRAYVMEANVEGRGTVYRVRIGPFETAAEAATYRRTFEDGEHMNTIVIRRRDS